jgi:hypothetical protein
LVVRGLLTPPAEAAASQKMEDNFFTRPKTRPRHNARRRNQRPRNRTNRNQNRPHRPSRLHHPTHKQRSNRNNAPARHDNRTLPRRILHRRRTRPAPRPPHLPKLQTARKTTPTNHSRNKITNKPRNTPPNLPRQRMPKMPLHRLSQPNHHHRTTPLLRKNPRNDNQKSNSQPNPHPSQNRRNDHPAPKRNKKSTPTNNNIRRSPKSNKRNNHITHPAAPGLPAKLVHPTNWSRRAEVHRNFVVAA